MPFGEELAAGVGGRTTSQGYVVDSVVQKFTGKMRDGESGLDYFGARYYSSEQGRFTGVDPINLTKYHIADPQRWNGYAYGINNPLVMIDLDGKFAWTFFIRSFIFTSFVGSFRGDARGPSTADSPAATSRISLRYTLDVDSSRITEHTIFSDRSRLYLPGVGNIAQRGSPEVKFGAVETFAHNEKVTELHYWGNDPLVPGSPDIDVHAKLAILEDKDKGFLSISGRVTGDTFPSTEAFVVDQSGTRVFLGAKYEEGGLGALYGDNKENLFEINMKIRFDKKGNFTAVIVDGKTYTIEAWNKKVQAQF